jgi:preprotein translocase subunit SecE
MAKSNPLEFLQEVRQEAKKITWPTRKETMITTVMVLIMVVLASNFFLLVDIVLNWGVEKMLFGM